MWTIIFKAFVSSIEVHLGFREMRNKNLMQEKEENTQQSTEKEDYNNRTVTYLSRRNHSHFQVQNHFAQPAV